MIIASQSIYPGVADVSKIVYDPHARHAIRDGGIVFHLHGVRVITKDIDTINAVMCDPCARFEIMT